MSLKEFLRDTIEGCHGLLTTYLSDLEDADLMVRPVTGANHIAWQLGHVIVMEQQMVELAGYTTPDLPDGFIEAHSPEASKCDDASAFRTKQAYLELLEQQRSGTLAALDQTAESDLDIAAPEALQRGAGTQTIAAVFHLIGMHELMHASQFVVVRRKLGKPVLI